MLTYGYLSGRITTLNRILKHYPDLVEQKRGFDKIVSPIFAEIVAIRDLEGRNPKRDPKLTMDTLLSHYPVLNKAATNLFEWEEENILRHVD